MKKSFVLLFLIVLVSSVIQCGCGKTEEVSNDDIRIPVIENESEERDYLLEGPVTVDYTIRYYDVVEDRFAEYSDSQYFETSAEPEFFIEKLAFLMQMRIDVNSVSVSGDSMTVDFSSFSAPLNGTGSYEENCILESVADIMFSVYNSINFIYYTADGKEYESGHIELSKDTPYAQR